MRQADKVSILINDWHLLFYNATPVAAVLVYQEALVWIFRCIDIDGFWKSVIKLLFFTFTPPEETYKVQVTSLRV